MAMQADMMQCLMEILAWMTASWIVTPMPEIAAAHCDSPGHGVSRSGDRRVS